MLVNGQLVHGGQAMAGEFGHITIDEEGPPCPCGKRGLLGALRFELGGGAALRARAELGSR